MTPPPLSALPEKDCRLCPRLADYRDANRAEQPDWFNAPVPCFGDPQAELLIAGLAPGVTGANRTGRPFTGDWAGDLLYATLDKFGFCKGTYAKHADDGLTLNNAMITNAVRCVPPQNKPVGAEITKCRPFLAARLASLPRLKVVLSLGKISHDSVVRTANEMGNKIGSEPVKLKDVPFGHATQYDLAAGDAAFTLISSYHCSRYNTNTGRLTTEMFEAVFAQVREVLL
ncbi:MAG: uracil-DNA glycosylase [Alphaproteobacteria bacterium]|nr:uracil-DNA glycosylase [Alphaproteobacteria bacterium]